MHRSESSRKTWDHPGKGSPRLANGEAILRQNPAELEFHFLSGTPRRSNLAERASFPLLRAETFKQFEDRPELNLAPDIFTEQEETPPLPTK
ncbi:hypothetical protein HPB47_002910, partial [Ixodes persulcatus]